MFNRTINMHNEIEISNLFEINNNKIIDTQILKITLIKIIQ